MIDFFNLSGPEIGSKEIIIRLFLSFFAGAVIGMERGRHKQFLSLRPHMLITMGSTLIMMLSIFIPQEFGFRQNYDPSRIAAQVVSGIGFLGAGAIIRFGVNVKGITTASTIWVSSAIGLAIGAGFYFPAVLVTILVLVILVFVDQIEKKIFRESLYKIISVKIDGTENYKEQIVDILKTNLTKIVTVNIEQNYEDNISNLAFYVHIPTQVDTEKICKLIRNSFSDGMVRSISFKTME